MKNLLLALIALFAVTSCLPKKKDKGIEPDLAGTYTMSKYDEDGTDYIADGGTGSLVLTRRDDTHIDFSYTIRYQGQTFPASASNVEIRKASGKNYDIYDDGSRVGSVDGTDFNLDAETTGGGRVKIIARK